MGTFLQKLGDETSWLNGRGSIWFRRFILKAEWQLGHCSSFTILQFSLDHGDGNYAKFAMGIAHVFTIWLSVGFWPSIIFPKPEDQVRKTGLSYHSPALWIYFWHDPTGWGPSRFKIIRLPFFRDKSE